MDPFDLARVQESLRRFAPACADRSPLYASLARSAATDDRVAGLLAAAPVASLRHPTLLFAAVHDLLLAEAERGRHSPEGEALAAHYPSVSTTGPTAPAGDPPPVTTAWVAFRAFCLAHTDTLRHTIATRSTQTNEVGRGSLLLAALRAVHLDTGQPLAWLDVGTSAGLNLLLDRYRFDFSGEAVGPPDASVHLACDVTGPAPVGPAPPLAWRRGLDRSPVDVTDPREARWLQACVWPEQTDRLARLRAALLVAAADPPDVVAGDAVGGLDDALAPAPHDAHVVVSHTWTLAYLDQERRLDFDDRLAALGQQRAITRLGLEGATAFGLELPAEEPWASVILRTDFADGNRRDVILARADDHGRWLRWLASPQPVTVTLRRG